MLQKLIGQETLLKKLKSREYLEHIPHAQLLYGPRGNGALGLALFISKLLFCESKSNQPCDECISCQRVSSFKHPDLHVSFPVVQSLSKTSEGFINEWRALTETGIYFNISNWISHMDPKGRKPIISVEESKHILNKMLLKSYEGGYKVVVIWMAEYMNIECSNKLLKLIEEPPQKTVFLLIAEDSHKILPTILSRTQKVFIPRADTESIVMYFKEHLKLSEMEAEKNAHYIQGDLSLLNENDFSNITNSNYFHHFSSLMRVCYKKDVNQMMNWSQEISQSSRDHQKQFLRYSLRLMQESIRINYLGMENVKLSIEEQDFLEKFAPYICEKNIREFMVLFEDSHYHIDRNVNTEIMFTQLCFQTMRYIHKSE